MTRDLPDQTDWLSQYLATTNDILWSHNIGGHGPKASGVTAPLRRPFWAENAAVIFIRKWRWLAFTVLVSALNFKFLTDAGPIDYLGMIKFFLLGLFLLLCGYVFTRLFSVKFKLTENRHVFHHAVMTKSGVILANETGEKVELSYEQIKSATHDYEQGARALKIVTHKDGQEYVLFGAGDFHEAIALIRGRIS